MIKQIALAAGDHNRYDVLYALKEDGTLWKMFPWDGDHPPPGFNRWKQIQPIQAYSEEEEPE